MNGKLLLLADVNSAHTIKLVRGFAQSGIEVGVFSLSRRKKEWYSDLKNVRVFDEHAFSDEIFSGSPLKKLRYIGKAKALRNIIKEFKPVAVHAHYATSYGLLGMLAGFHPFYVSVWGSDVMDFPNKSIVNRKIISKVLRSADRITATSPTLRNYVKQISGLDSLVIPFGVDTDLFAPKEKEETKVVFGTVKSLEEIYCIDLAIKAFARLVKNAGAGKAQLLIVGDGSEKEKLFQLTRDLGIESEVVFTGRVDHSAIAEYHQRLDVLVNVSRTESFGVSVLESMSCGKPVIVTDTGGLAEIVRDEKDGIRIPVNDEEALFSAMLRLFESKMMREEFGSNGRKRVEEEYSWKHTMELFGQLYNSGKA